MQEKFRIGIHPGQCISYPLPTSGEHPKLKRNCAFSLESTRNAGPLNDTSFLSTRDNTILHKTLLLRRRVRRHGLACVISGEKPESLLSGFSFAR